VKGNDYTRIGGGHRRFPSTHWTAIQEVGSGDDADSRRMIGDLLGDYWKPVYCYLRRRGHSNEEAKDLTQGFFQEVVLSRDLIGRADPTRGRFRTLLLSALGNYVSNVHRRQSAQKRIPKHKLIHLDQADPGALPAAIEASDPAETFQYAWVSELLDRMLEEVEAGCRADSMETHWNLFRDRVLSPTLEDRTPPPLGQLCAKYGLKEPAKASNMIFAVKRRMQAALKRYIRQSVARDEDISEEIRELQQFLTGSRQSSR
jgi:RNA polymerase sigma-70 factor (ECF subfamily)